MSEPHASQALLDLDRLVHEPARLAILSVLAGVEEAEFKFLEGTLGLTKGNLSVQTSKLEAAGYLEIRKAFRGKTPVTSYRLTPEGRAALDHYKAQLRALLLNDR